MAGEDPQGLGLPTAPSSADFWTCQSGGQCMGPCCFPRAFHRGSVPH